MRLSARPLVDVEGVNDFQSSTQLEYHVGDATDFYLQLVDMDKNSTQQGFYPSGLRYCAITAATLQVTFINISNSKQFVRFASQPFATDTSIWTVPLLATDTLQGTVSIKCVLSENIGTSQAPVIRTRTFTLAAAILVQG
jgi:hypothetical protein